LLIHRYFFISTKEKELQPWKRVNFGRFGTAKGRCLPGTIGKQADIDAPPKLPQGVELVGDCADKVKL
jgi:hypothetical protein